MPAPGIVWRSLLHSLEDCIVKIRIAAPAKRIWTAVRRRLRLSLAASFIKRTGLTKRLRAIRGLAVLLRCGLMH